MKIFLDANILVSVLNKEFPLFSYTSRVLSLIDHPPFRVYTSPTCLAIAFYFAEKKNGQMVAKKKIAMLAEKIEITPTDKSTVMDALSKREIHDFEDGLQYYAAVNSKCECIVTEDIADFYFSGVEVLTAQTFLEKYLE